MNILRWLSLHPRRMLTVTVLACLAGFVAKPFNVDDPLFIWVARHIPSHPANPYGFNVNWYGTPDPMCEVTMNPPLTAYYLAIAGSILGWSEPGLHGAMLLPAIALVLGTRSLATHFCRSHALASLLTLASPVVMISSTTVMSDVMMLAFWVWALVFWLEAAHRVGWWRYAVAAGLISLAEMTKYYGVCLVPLLAAHSFIRDRGFKPSAAWLLVPVVVLGVYDLAAGEMYGDSLLSRAASYASGPDGVLPAAKTKLEATLIALAFIGGCIAPVTIFAPFLWRTRALFAIAGSSGLVTMVFAACGIWLKNYGPIQGSSRVWLGVQTMLWAMGGLSALGLAVAEMRRDKTPEAWLLALWVMGTFVFTALINWTVNGRSVLPMAPAICILIVRRWEARATRAGQPLPVNVFDWKLAGPLAVSFALSFLAAHADYSFARSVRKSAELTFAKYGHGRFWFQGHWGFQYYMERLGARALDEKSSPLSFGDIVAQPVNNTNYRPLNPEVTVLHELLTVPGPRFIATMKGETGAGFYASSRGPLPFAFGKIPPEQVAICVLQPPISK